MKRRTGAEAPDEVLLQAMREVDALTPACPPIAPQPSPTYRREEWLAGLVVPDSRAAEVRPPGTGRGISTDALARFCGFALDVYSSDYVHPDGRRVSRVAAELRGMAAFDAKP